MAAAAYRSGTCLENEYDGRKHDFQKKQWILHKEIMLPEHAPSEYQDRSILWNAVEKSEKASNAQLAREVELALPKELTLEQQIRLVQDYVKRNFVDQGMCADIAIHSPPRTNDRHQPIDSAGQKTRIQEQMIFENPHAHILLTVRPIDQNGKWEPKSQTVYLCKNGSEEKGFTAVEYKEANKNGWEKQYQFQSEKKKIWYTMKEGEAQKLERVSRTPKTERFGRKNPVTEYWNSKDRILEWRKDWEVSVNRELEYIGSMERIDSRSFKDQGREQELPTMHMGVAATNMEKRATREELEGISADQIRHSDIGSYNAEVQKYNSMFRRWKEKASEVWNEAKAGLRKVAEELADLRGRLLKTSYELAEFQRKNDHRETNYQQQQEEFSKMDHLFQSMSQKNESSRKLISDLEQQLKDCSTWNFVEKHRIHVALDKEKTAASTRNEYLDNQLHRLGYENKDHYLKFKNSYGAEKAAHKKYVETMEKMQDKQEHLHAEFQRKWQELSEKDQGQVARMEKEIQAEKRNVSADKEPRNTQKNKEQER